MPCKLKMTAPAQRNLDQLDPKVVPAVMRVLTRIAADPLAVGASLTHGTRARFDNELSDAGFSTVIIHYHFDAGANVSHIASIKVLTGGLH